MAYNPDLAKEGKIPPGEIIEGAIINIQDGKTRDFVNEDSWDSWQGDLDSQAIEVLAEGKYKGQTATCKTLFNFTIDPEDNAPVFSASPKSKAYKFKAMYGNYPKVGQKVKLASDTKGYWKLFLG